MVDREVDGPVWVVLGRFGGLCVRSWAALGAFVGGPGPLLWPLLAVLGRSWASAGGLGPLLGPMLAVLGRPWGSVGGPGLLLGPILVVLGCSWGSVGGPGPLLGPMLAVLGRSWGLCWRSWAALGPLRAVRVALGTYLGDLGPLLGPSWGLCWRSWAALGVHVGGPGALGRLGAKSGQNSSRKAPGPPLGPLLAVLGRSWDLCWRSWASVDWARWARRDRWDGPDRSEAQYRFVPETCMYMYIYIYI